MGVYCPGVAVGDSQVDVEGLSLYVEVPAVQVGKQSVVYCPVEADCPAVEVDGLAFDDFVEVGFAAQLLHVDCPVVDALDKLVSVQPAERTADACLGHQTVDSSAERLVEGN